MATSVDTPPAADDAGTPVAARSARRVRPRLAAAGVAAALLAGGVATAPAEPSSPEPLAFRQGFPVKWTGCC
jgi:hypothetical protein